MANTFKNYTSTSVGTGATTVYTVPSSTTAVTIGLTVANRTSAQILIDVQCAGAYVVKDAPIPTGSGLSDKLVGGVGLRRGRTHPSKI